MRQQLRSAGPLMKKSNHSFKMLMATQTQLEEDINMSLAYICLPDSGKLILHRAAGLLVLTHSLFREISVCILICFQAIMVSD